MEIFVALCVGLAAGVHAAIWGMYKDSPHEGFTWSTWIRSPILATAIAVLLTLFTPASPLSAGGVVVLFGVTYALERALVELYKTFLRDEDQSKYTIPMQFSVGGEPVESRAVRLAVGAVYFAGELAVLYGVWWLGRSGPELSPLVTVLVVGTAGGWISAFGGAWKDAPVEGFHLLKFFRSPAISFAWGLLVASLTTEYVFIFLGALGYTIATTETYKTFFFPDEPRGKFAEAPIEFPEMKEKRNRFVPAYAGVWLLVLAAMAVALVQGTPGGLL